MSAQAEQAAQKPATPAAVEAKAPATTAPAAGQSPMVTPLPPPIKQLAATKSSVFASPPPRQGMSEFQRTSFRVWGSFFTRRPVQAKLAESLMKARTGVRPEALQSAGLMAGIMGGMAGAMATVFFLLIFVPALGIEMAPPFLLIFALMPLMMGFGGYAAVVAGPGSRAKSRGKDIDQRLPYALNYIAAMASAGVNVDTIFKSLGEQKIYGEVAREAEAIYRDIALFGKDTVTAFRRAIARTPSRRFAELLQGAITTFGSGGDLQLYFSSKAQRYMVENRQEQKQYLDTMGLMAETYVTTAVAGPLFLMVMMAIMGMLSGQGPGQLTLIVYLMLPTANFGFTYGLMAMTPKV